jgi:hypothetical protein
MSPESRSPWQQTSTGVEETGKTGLVIRQEMPVGGFSVFVKKRQYRGSNYPFPESRLPPAGMDLLIFVSEISIISKY